MLADFPPNSSNTFFTVPVACVMICLPTRVDPVNVTMSTRGSSVRVMATDGSDEVTTFTTPGGMSVCSAIRRPNSVDDHGVSGAGRTTTVLPAASAGTTFVVQSMKAQFQVKMAATTPTAS